MRLLAIGSAIIDEIIHLERLPRSGEDVIAKDRWTELGGCAANVAVCAIRLTVPSAILCRVGQDERGQFILGQLKKEGISTENVIIDPQNSSGYCISLVEADAQRSFITFDGANLAWSQADVPHNPRADILYISGYELVESASADILVPFLEAAADGGKAIVFDPGPMISSIPSEIFARVAAISTLLTPNQAEAQEFCQDDQGIEAWAKRLAAFGAKTVVIKLGAQGCYYHTSSGHGYVPGFPVQPVDSTGAGDSFTGACIYGMATGLPLQESLKLANAVGAIVVSGRGPQAPIPSLAQVIEFL